MTTNKNALAILSHRKQVEGQVLSTTHTLTAKQYLEIAAWLFETFNSFEVVNNKDGNCKETVKLTIGF